MNTHQKDHKKSQEDLPGEKSYVWGETLAKGPQDAQLHPQIGKFCTNENGLSQPPQEHIQDVAYREHGLNKFGDDSSE
jgi:hypothetical protein